MIGATKKEFWDSSIELMSKGDLEELQLKRLQHVIRKAYECNPFYRMKYKEAGVHPEDIKRLEDLNRVPFIEKRDVRSVYPWGLAVEPREKLVEMHSTLGTTGKPTPVFATGLDIDRWSDLVARNMWMTGIRPGYIIQNAYAYGLPTGGFGFHYGARRMGCMLIPIGVGQTNRQIEIIMDFEVDAICMTPSYALYLGQRAREIGVDLAEESNLKVGMFGAEPWPWATRMKIEELMGIRAYDEYGMTEFLGPGMACECGERDGLHVWADAFLLECVDPETGEQVNEGEKGELVWTWLSADGSAMIRYRSRDLATVSWERCACGRTHPKFSSILGRADDSVSIGGYVIYPSQLEDVLLKYSEVGANFRIILENVRGLDKLTVKAEVSDIKLLRQLDQVEMLSRSIARGIKSAVGVTPTVELVEPDTLPRSIGGESKTATTRVEDRRDR